MVSSKTIFSCFLKLEVLLFVLFLSAPCLFCTIRSDARPIINNIVLDHISLPRSVGVVAIYQFGDSYADTGNSIRLGPSSNCGKLPYGQAYLEHPTGRCSDGLLIIDYFAKYLNISLLDAYLNKDGNFTQGVDFAVVGAVALKTPVLRIPLTSNVSLSVQLSWFKSHLSSFYPDIADQRRQLARSLVFMGEIGSNDYNFAFYLKMNSFTNVHRMTPYVIQAIRNGIKEIINVGATRIAIPGSYPIGCLPTFLNNFKTNDTNMYDELKCLKKYNMHIQYHNQLLQQTIIQLQKAYPNITIVYLDYYGAFKDIFQHPQLYGFDESVIHAACCGGGDDEYNLNFNIPCGSDGARVCKNPERYISWDGIHLTQRFHQVMAKKMIPSLLRALYTAE